MILHAVFCQIREDVDPRAVFDVFEQLRMLCARLDGALSFEAGPNRDFEGKSAQFSDGFVIRFSNRQALMHYAEHDTHKQLGAQLCDLCVGGADGITVFDLETT